MIRQNSPLKGFHTELFKSLGTVNIDERMPWCRKPDTRQRIGGHDAGLVDQDCTDEGEDDDGDDYEGDDNYGPGDGEWMEAMPASLQMEEKNLWAQFHEWLKVPGSLWNTNDASKSFWTIREETSQELRMLSRSLSDSKSLLLNVMIRSKSLSLKSLSKASQ